MTIHSPGNDMSGTPPPSLADLLHTFRLRAGMSQETLAERSGVSVRTISDLERGQRTTAHLETIRLLAQALDLTDDERRSLIASAHPAASQPVSAPAPAGPTRQDASLPTPTNPLVGRTHELETLLAMLSERNAIVTLTGTGGVGKTRLAVEAAHRLVLLDDRSVVFVPLVSVSQGEGVPVAIAQALDLPTQAGTSVERLAALVADRRLLLILDNFEHLLEAAPLLPALVRLSKPDSAGHQPAAAPTVG